MPPRDKKNKLLLLLNHTTNTFKKKQETKNKNKMLQYVMTKLETHNINSDGQIMPNHIEQVSSKLIYYLLEPVCCKKQQKEVPDQLLVCGIGNL